MERSARSERRWIGLRKWLLAFAVIGLCVYALAFALAPRNHGIEPALFAETARGSSAASHSVQVADAAARKPNIIVILADDLGYGDLGIQGASAIATPSLDRLANDGMRFSDFYASAPICSPSRAGLLTGRYPLRSGIMTAMQAANDTPMRRIMYQLGVVMSHFAAVDMLGGKNAVQGLPQTEITIAESLRGAGYRTMAVGKWHLGDFTELPQYHPFEHGFDEFVGFNASNDDFPVAFWRGDREIVEDIGAEQEQYTRVFTEEAVQFIENSREAPFFLYLAHKDPHLPFFPSDAFAGNSEAGPYGDAVAEFDWSVGQVIETLERLHLEENTLVIVTSDNGPWFDGSAGGLRGRKGQSYEGGFRVPLIAWWPGQVEPGSLSDVPGMNIDFYPTFLKLAGVALPSDRIIDGVDLGPILKGSGADLDSRPLYFFHDYDVEAIRLREWKYFRSTSHGVWPVPLDKSDSLVGKLAGARDYTPKGSDEAIPTLGTWPLLYQIRRDRNESYNVLKKYPELARELGQRLETWRSEFYANPRGWLDH
ncbi:MAG: sulfatase [bacterium]|nr:sulfatase [bacterium]